MKKTLTPAQLKKKIIVARVLRLCALGFAVAGVFMFIFAFMATDNFFAQFEDPLAILFFALPFIPALGLSVIARLKEKSVMDNIESALQLKDSTKGN